MTKKRKRCKELIIVLAAIIIGAGCFFAGRVTASSRYQDEQEINVGEGSGIAEEVDVVEHKHLQHEQNDKPAQPR